MNQEEIYQRVRSISESTLRSRAAQVDGEAIWPEAALRELQSAGLGGLTVPKEFGGLGEGLETLVRTSEILGGECASVAMCFGMHCVASAVISAKATDDQVERFLVPISNGKHITTLSLSEPGTGSHFYIPQTTMNENGQNGFKLNGTKSFVTNGGHADSYVVSTVAESSSAPMGEFSMILVSENAPGLEWQAQWNGFGMRGNSSRNLKLVDTVVPENNLLGQSGDQLWYVFEVVAPYFLMAMAGTYLGVATEALNEGITHLKERSFQQSASSLASVSVLQHRLGVLWSRLESTRQLVYHAARLGDQKRDDALPAVLSAKAEVGDTATMIVNEVMTLLGGAGYGENGKVSRLLRDVRAAHVMSPTTDLLRTWVGRALLGQPLLTDG